MGCASFVCSSTTIDYPVWIHLLSQIHILSRTITHVGLVLMKYLSLNKIDSILIMMSKLVYGDLSKFGIQRPKEGPFVMKDKYGKYPVIDLGTCRKIKQGEIQVNYTYKDIILFEISKFFSLHNYRVHIKFNIFK
ncbi:hypothetical protein F511_06859 [Dorcoceras hygrometricum]|uniref:Uncharacterized protein n=1 Tax=Dorcoceras hygrometricum TaxID=472368 RepID=A0A2Z7BKJ4_9LAMI|nr:hypothetical protein F511_06859 [Dorcoceras hygrometricum]